MCINQCKVTPGTYSLCTRFIFAPNDVHTNCNTIHTMYHNTQYCNTPQVHKIAINMMQNNKSSKVIILHNNNNNNSKHL